jgi:hypothetical protein
MLVSLAWHCKRVCKRSKLTLTALALGVFKSALLRSDLHASTMLALYAQLPSQTALARTMGSARSHALPQMCVLLLLAVWASIVRAGELCVCWMQSVAVAYAVRGAHCDCSHAACGLTTCAQTNAWTTAACVQDCSVDTCSVVGTEVPCACRCSLKRQRQP